MSEFKGQLLGMVLVILVFAAIAGSMKGMFSKEVSAISSKFDTALNSNYTAGT